MPQLEYTPQELKVWKLNQDFINIKNCDIIPPTWKSLYWEEFFLWKRKDLIDNKSFGKILDRKVIDWVSYYLYESAWLLKFGTDTTELYSWVKWVVEHIEIWYGANIKIMDWITISAPSSQLNPSTMTVNDVYAWSYLELVLTGTWIDSNVLAGQYLLFTTQLSNLSGISTKIWYKETIDANNIKIYIRWTNKSWSTPTVWESVSVYKTYWPVPVLSTKDSVYMLPLDWVNAITPVLLYQTNDTDSIVDIAKYNGVLFIMTTRYIYFSQTLTWSNVNIYPLDFIDNVNWWLRIVPFGKMMILFWERNGIITPINSTDSNLGYVYVDLNYEYSLYSKYSVLSYVWSLYVLQDNKYLVTLDIVSVSNTDYNVKSNIIHYKWMLDNLTWPVYIKQYDKSILMYEQLNNSTNVFKYDTEYFFWNTHEYLKNNVYWLEDIAYGDKLWDLWYNKNIEQSITWSIWDNDMYIMKMLYYIKFVIWYRTDEPIDLLLDVTTYIWWTYKTVTHKLHNYSINNDITNSDVMWKWIMWGKIRPLWKLFSFAHTINRSWDLFKIVLRSNNNELIYWWSICWTANYAPFVTALWNKT